MSDYIRPETVWVMTDGKAGDRNQAFAIANTLVTKDGIIEERLIQPRKFYELMAPWGPCDPGFKPCDTDSMITAPWPDIIIATGRRTVPTMRQFVKLGKKRPFLVFLKNPRISKQIADCIWMPSHDLRNAKNKTLTDKNLIYSLTGPIRLTPEKLKKQLNKIPKWLEELPEPRLSVVIGGDAGKTKYTQKDADRLATIIKSNQDAYQSFIITTSRRTPDHLRQAMRDMLKDIQKPCKLYTGEGNNPYPVMLAASKSVIVTGDSHNMVSEALASEATIYIFRPTYLQSKIAWFLDCVEAKGHAKPLQEIKQDTMQEMQRKPFAANAEIAEAILKYYARFLQKRDAMR
jgi:mitochondrial fission protein ELM1